MITLQYRGLQFLVVTGRNGRVKIVIFLESAARKASRTASGEQSNVINRIISKYFDGSECVERAIKK